MSEQIYLQVEDAIRRRLHVRRARASGGYSYWHPLSIQDGNIVLRDSDLGQRTRTITTDEWAELAEHGVWQLVGIWDFVRADDPAAGAIAYCHRNPNAAGRELYQHRQEAAP